MITQSMLPYLEVDQAVLVDMAHPNIIEVGGGPYYYIETLSDEYNMYSKQGLSLKNLIIKKASKVVKTDADLQAMVPYIRTFDADSGPITEDGFFLIVSQDGGKSWYFTDMKKYDAESIKLFIPNYNERLNIYINSVSH